MTVARASYDKATVADKTVEILALHSQRGARFIVLAKIS